MFIGTRQFKLGTNVKSSMKKGIIADKKKGIIAGKKARREREREREDSS